MTLNRTHIILLSILGKMQATSAATAITTDEIEKFCPLGKSYTTLHRAIRSLYLNGYIAQGINTEVERRAVREAAMKAGARQVHIIEEPMAAAIGAGLPVAEACGSMVVDIGGGTCEVAVISLGGIVASKSVRVGGDEFDSAIISYIKRKYNLLIGERSAEAIKMTIGSAFPFEEELEMEIKGRNLVDGLPKNMFVTSEEIRDALADPLSSIVDAIKSTLERTPPELSADIIDHGITLTGGGSLLHNIDKLVSKETGMPVYIAENPLDCVAAGAGEVLDNIDLLKEVVSDSERRLG